jgi:RND family efflux transporter MFP subunit
MNKSFRYAASVIALAIVVAGTGCNQPAPQTPAAAPPPPKPPEVLVELPNVADVTDYEDFTGRTMAFKSADIRPHVTGYLDKIYFQEGADVKEGDLLYEIDPRTYQAELERAKSNQAQAEAHYKRLTADLQRASGLITNKIITREEFDRIVGDQSEAEAAVGVAKAQVHLAEVNLTYTKIIAPFNGRLSRTMFDPGNLVKADETVLTTIVRLDPIYAMFGVDERLLKRIHDYIESGLIKKNKDGQIPILMGLADEEGFPHPGTVDFIDNRLDINTGTLQVRGVFPNPKHVILPGLFCRIRLPLGDPYRALTVPELALSTDQGQKFIYVVNDQNKIEYRKIQIGKMQGTQRVILKGINEGDRVVVSGLQRVRPGVLVDPKPAPAAVASATDGKSAEGVHTATEPTSLTNGEKR